MEQPAVQLCSVVHYRGDPQVEPPGEFHGGRQASGAWARPRTVESSTSVIDSAIYRHCCGSLPSQRRGTPVPPDIVQTYFMLRQSRGLAISSIADLGSLLDFVHAEPSG